MVRLGIPGRQRIIIPLDVPDAERGRAIGGELVGRVGAFKIGWEAIDGGYGHELADYLIENREQVFWDHKMDDIPNTSGNATGSLRRRIPKGIWAINVHASSGPDSVKAVVDQAEGAKVWGVTLLTSITPEQCVRMFGAPPEVIVPRWAGIALEQGVDGIICSPKEVELLRKEYGWGFDIATPGVRPAGSATQDQARVDTPGNAVAMGSDYLVIGRPITEASDPIEVINQIIVEVDESYTVSGFESQGAIHVGHVVLTGRPEGAFLRRHSSHYANKDLAAFNPQFVRGLAKLAWHRLTDEGVPFPDVVVAPAVGAITFGAMLGEVYGTSFAYCEDDENDKDRMVFKRGFGPRIRAGMKVVVAEDIISSGGTVLKTIEAVRQQGAKVVGVAVEWQRGSLETDVPVVALAKKQFPMWPGDECDLCRKNQPVDHEPGHGVEFLNEFGEDPANWPANKSS